MSKRVILAAVATAVVGGFAGSAAATTDLPVTVTRDANGTHVHSHLGSQPLAGVDVGNDGNVCYGFSYEVGHCTSDFIPPIVTIR